MQYYNIKTRNLVKEEGRKTKFHLITVTKRRKAREYSQNRYLWIWSGAIMNEMQDMNESVNDVH